MRNCTATTYAVIFFGAGIGARGAAERASPDLRRPCGPLPPALRAGTPVVVLLAHAGVQCARSAARSFPLGSPLLAAGGGPWIAESLGEASGRASRSEAPLLRCVRSPGESAVSALRRRS